MKPLLLTFALLFLHSVTTVAQGTITFANTVLSRVMLRDAPGATPYVMPAGAPFVFGVFWGTSIDNLTLNAGALGTASTVNPGIIAATSPYQIDGAQPGTTVYMKIAGWAANFNRDFAAPRVQNFGYGETAIRRITLGPTAGPGTVIWSSVNSALFPPLIIDVPEPSVLALSVMGAGALFFFGRKKQIRR